MAELGAVAQSARRELRVFDTVAALLSDDNLSYTTGTKNTVVPGDAIYAQGFTYEVAESDASDEDITTAGGVKLYAANELRPEMFDSIEDAITAAAQNGRALRGTPGKTYTFTTGVTVANAPLIADFTGCFLVRSNTMSDRSALRVQHDMSETVYGDCDSVSAMSLEQYAFTGGTIETQRITLSSVAGYSAGDIVRVFSADKIPSISPWVDTRYAESGEIEAVDSGNNYLWMTRPFAESWTATKIARMSSHKVTLVGGEWSDEPGYAVSRRTPMIELYGCVRPECRNMHFRDTQGTQLLMASCYEPVSRGNIFNNPRHLPAQEAYGYGEKHIGTTRPVQEGAVGSGCRHIFDTGGQTVSDENLAIADVWDFGGVVNATVINGVGYDSINAPFNDHPDAYGTKIINCRSIYSNRRAPQTTLWGVQIRGRHGAVIGGVYEGLNPLKIELSTDDPCLVKDTVLKKLSVSDYNAALEACVTIDGTGLASGQANITLENVHIEQDFGRKEILSIDDAKVVLSGSVRYAATLSNAVFALLDNASELIIRTLDADFSGSSAPSPMLTKINDAGSSVTAMGSVTILGSPAASSFIVLTDFNDAAGSAWWHSVVGDGDFFGSDGWRNEDSAARKVATIVRSDA
jgi:hypothetical protein